MHNEVESGVEHGAVLLRFADAAVGRAPDLAEAREALHAAMGADAVVDCAAVVANFQRMVRIADGCGIPLDPVAIGASADFRERLGVHAYSSAANTPGARVGS